MADARTVRLTGGFPREPEHGDWEELTSLPGPPRLVEALYRGMLDVDVTSDTCRKLAEPEPLDDEGDVVIHRFFCGHDDVGYAQTEQVITVSSDFPVGVTITSAGLPGVKLVWRFDLAYQGQLGHCGFRHRDLVVTFADTGTEDRFATFWQQVFGLRPVFAPV